MNQFHVVLDGLVTVVPYALAWFIMIGSGWSVPKSEVLPPGVYMAALLLIVPIYLMLYFIFRFSTPKRVQGRRVEPANICKVNVLGTLVFMTLLLPSNKNPYIYSFSRKMALLFIPINIILEAVERNFIRTALHSIRSKGYNQKYISLVGYSRMAEGFIDRVQQNSE